MTDMVTSEPETRFAAQAGPLDGLYEKSSAFLATEACLLDSGAYDDWLQLWDSSGELSYWVPSNDDDADPKVALGFIYDNRKHLEERIARLKDRRAHAFVPRPRIQRVVGNVQVAVQGHVITVQSSYVLGARRKNHQSVWFARTKHELLARGEQMVMRSKTVYLLNNNDPIPNIDFLP